ncbi:hypothetical protein J1N35_043976 [Gossypium stocksii]|uniref:Uncharacterized protein n=1 Tax=Gossypium stocksii TaxID=47602 RepID=A0A9D3U8B1_9ROSI|nr:hypothetical protein J1N35_043976 [Gossypium stocksii]
MNTNITLPHGRCLSYLLRQLGIRTHGDTLVTSNQLISYGAFHHVGYLFNANTSMWLKSDHPTKHGKGYTNAAFEDFSAPVHAPPPTSSSHATQPSSKVNSAMLDAILSLSNDVWGLRKEDRTNSDEVWGLREEFQSYREDVNSRLSTLESQMASLLACFPSTPPFSPPHDD